MKIKSLFLLPTIALCLTSCGTVSHKPEEYILKLNYSPDYRILQLSDPHIGDKDNTELHYKFMDLTINEAKPNLIVISGDLFTFASRGTAKEFFKFIDDHGIDWTVCFGNHDQQCYFSIDWLTGLLNNYGSHCVFKDIQDDTVHGNSNFAINLMKGNDIFEQIIVMDSNRYNFSGYFGYDYFKQNQIDWYSDLIDYTTKQNGNKIVPSLMFYHIPLPEVRDAWEAAKADPSLNLNNGVLGEEPCNPKYNSGFFKVIEQKGSTRGMYFGHDHINNFIVKYKNIDFGYGIKATDRVYYGDTLLGGRVITIHDDETHSLSYQDIYHQYKEVL